MLVRKWVIFTYLHMIVGECYGQSKNLGEQHQRRSWGSFPPKVAKPPVSYERSVCTWARERKCIISYKLFVFQMFVGLNIGASRRKTSVGLCDGAVTESWRARPEAKLGLHSPQR